MIGFILGISLTLNIVLILLIIFAYKKLKRKLLTPKIEKNFDVNDYITKSMDNILSNIFGKEEEK